MSAQFFPPPITTADRTGLTLDDGELVYDTDTQTFWQGDGSTAGGIELGAGGGGTVTNSDYNNAFFLMGA
jgi:hypothetical protein